MGSLRALASQLGLSPTTVSRALDGYSDVSEATRVRVRSAAAAIGYRPNSAARRLRKGLTEAVALVMPTEPGHFYEPVFAELLGVIGQRLAERGFDLVLMAARPGPEEQAAYRRIVRERRADACVVVRSRRDDERVRYLRAERFPFVCHGRTDSAEPYAFVDGDGEGGFAELTRRLIGLGHRRIAHLAAPDEFTYSGLRRRGWRDAMRAAGLDDTLVRVCAATEDGGEAAASELIQVERPTAIVCSTDRIAIGAIRAAVAAGLVVGRDIAVSGHDDIHAAAVTNPPLTTMSLDVASVGSSLTAMLFALIEGIGEPAGEIFPLRQIPRASTGEGPPPD